MVVVVVAVVVVAVVVVVVAVVVVVVAVVVVAVVVVIVAVVVVIAVVVVVIAVIIVVVAVVVAVAVAATLVSVLYVRRPNNFHDVIILVICNFLASLHIAACIFTLQVFFCDILRLFLAFVWIIYCFLVLECSLCVASGMLSMCVYVCVVCVVCVASGMLS